MQHLRKFLQNWYTIAPTHVPLTRPKHIAETYFGTGNILYLWEGAANPMAKGRDIYTSRIVSRELGTIIQSTTLPQYLNMCRGFLNLHI